jgi:hypothetical protein
MSDWKEGTPKGETYLDQRDKPKISIKKHPDNQVNCTTCKGSGFKNKKKNLRCTVCHGTGKVKG